MNDLDISQRRITPLQFATVDGDVELAELLLQQGADVNTTCEVSELL